MKIGISTYYGINSKAVLGSVEELEKAGFNVIELMYEFRNLITDQEALKLKQKNMDYSMHGPFVNVTYTHPNLEFSEYQIKLIEKSLETAKLIGCSHYVMHGGLIPKPYLGIENPYSRDDFVNLFIERFKSIFEKYSDDDMQILMENVPAEKSIGGKVSDIEIIQEEMPSVGFCFDIAHAEIAKQTDDILRALKIDYIHATDNNLVQDEHMIIGKGKIDYRTIISVLKDKGFKGKFILENLSYADCCSSFINLEKII